MTIKESWEQEHKKELRMIHGKDPITKAEYDALMKELGANGFYKWMRTLEDKADLIT